MKKDIQKEKEKKLSAPQKTDNPLVFYFSFRGTFSRLEFILAFMSLQAFYFHTAEKDNFIYTCLVYLVTFYACLAAIQKRCRDLNLKGTLFILMFSIATPLLKYYHYMKHHGVRIEGTLRDVIIAIGMVFMIFHFILILTPGKKEKDMALTSPLLKYPYIYTAVCFILTLSGLYAFNQWYF